MRPPRAAATMLIALTTLAVAGCGEESDGTFDSEGFPFTFEYPDGFSETEDVSFNASAGAKAAESAAVVIDDNDGIALQRYDLTINVGRSNLSAVKREFDALFRQIDPHASSQASRIAGIPALTIDRLAVPGVDGGESKIVALFEGDREYLFNCQSTPDHRDEVAEACDLAFRTLKAA